MRLGFGEVEAWQQKPILRRLGFDGSSSCDCLHLPSKLKSDVQHLSENKEGSFCLFNPKIYTNKGGSEENRAP